MKPTKPYSVTVGEKAFNWRTALKKAISRKQKTSPSLTEKAKSWVTCACGNVCSVIPRYDGGSPKDNRLNNLGCTFYDDVNEGDFKAALVTLDKIEKRSGELLKVIFALQKEKDEHKSAIQALEKELDLAKSKLTAKRDSLKTACRNIMTKAEKAGIYASSVGDELF